MRGIEDVSGVGEKVGGRFGGRRFVFVGVKGGGREGSRRIFRIGGGLCRAVGAKVG